MFISAIANKGVEMNNEYLDRIKYLPKTQKGLTITSEGEIPHLLVGGVYFPVKTDLHEYGRLSSKQINDYPAPLRTKNGFLVYAMPGGKEYVNDWSY